MNTVTRQNSKPHLQRSRRRKPSGRLFCSTARLWLTLFAAVTLATTARAGGGQTTPVCITNHIVCVTNCTGTNLTIQLDNFCQGPLVVQCGGVTLNGAYNYASQTYSCSRPTNLPSGTCLLMISKNGACVASTNVVICDCGCTGSPGPQGPAGPPGPAGPAGANGPPGPQGIKGATGPMGLTGLTGATGATGSTGLRGPAGPAGTNGLNGTNGLTGATGATGLAGPAGSPGATGPTGLTGLTGPAGPAGINGLNATNGATGATGPAGGSAQYAYIYNLSAQVVPLETAVTFDSNGIETAGFVHGLGGSEITIVNQGIYKVTFSVSGSEPSQFALFINGVVVAESVYGSGAGTQQNNGQAIVALGANDVLTLVNHTSAAAVTLAAEPPIGGTAPTVNASILIQQLD